MTRRPYVDLHRLRSLLQEHFSWSTWADRIEQNGITIDRPRGSAHPDYPSVIYPLNYGYIPNTVGPDGEPVDVFVGTADVGLVGALLTTDYRQEPYDLKFLVDCTPAEVYTAHGFINYDRTLLEGVLVLRHPMPTLWAMVDS